MTNGKPARSERGEEFSRRPEVVIDAPELMGDCTHRVGIGLQRQHVPCQAFMRGTSEVEVAVDYGADRFDSRRIPGEAI
jgi:hypothetical protein